MNRESQIAELQKPLDSGKVKPPPQGKYGEYVDGYHVITEANRIFGEDGWSYSITRLEQTCRHETTDRNGNPQIRVGYLCTVRVEAMGTFKEGAAVGTGMAKPENEGDAHESAVKEAETDAIKRGLRSYGYTFGLALYEKEKTNVKTPFDAPGSRDRMLTAVGEQNTQSILTKLTTSKRWQETYDQLPPPMQNEVTAAVNARKRAIQADDDQAAA